MRQNVVKIVCWSVFVTVLVNVISFLMPKNPSLYIENATVNPNNGDIAVTYHKNNGDEGYTIDLYLFDAEGNLLLFKKHESKGGSFAKVKFVNDNIHIYASRADASYGYDREGNTITPLTKAEWKEYEFKEWDGWKSSRGEKTYTLGDTVYRYSYVPYPKSAFEFGCSLSIENTKTGNTVTLLEFE